MNLLGWLNHPSRLSLEGTGTSITNSLSGKGLLIIHSWLIDGARLYFKVSAVCILLQQNFCYVHNTINLHLVVQEKNSQAASNHAIGKRCSCNRDYELAWLFWELPLLAVSMSVSMSIKVACRPANYYVLSVYYTVEAYYATMVRQKWLRSVKKKKSRMML